MIPYIRSAAERGIAVFMDNTPNVTNDNVYFVSNIASEQAEPARKIGEWIVAKYKDKPDVKIAVLEGFPGVVSDRRLEGLKEGIAGHDNIRIVASQPADWTRAKGHDVTENILTAHRDIDIIVGLYDEMALGAVAAVKAKGLLGKVTICGYDHTKDANASIKAGELTCTVDTGYPQKAVLLLNAVKEYCKEGKTVPRYLNPEFRVYDKDNIDTYDTAQFD
jgi:ribose transport system substrate-binding protein